MSGALTKIILRGGLIMGVVSLATVAAYASTREPSMTAGTFYMSGFDLKIDSVAWYNGVSVPSATWALKNLTPSADKFFNFDDIKPGDYGCNVISMHVKKGNAWLCLDFKNLTNTENGFNEPESLVDNLATTTGELAGALQFFGWIDNGDNKFKTGEKILFGTSTKAASTILNNKTYTIGDSGSGSYCKKDETKYVGICWCAGAISLDGNTGAVTCDGKNLGNIAQTDKITFDVRIRAASADDNKNFLCNPTPPPPPPPPPPPKAQYCSHGYWKQSQHFDNWVGYSPNQQFSSVFDNAFPGQTLLDVLQNGGGGLTRLGRETVGALLNAGKLGNFPYTQAQVISMFNAAYPGSSSTYSNLADKFELDENCPLN